MRLADPFIRVTDLDVEPIGGDGYSGNLLWRVRLTWAGTPKATGARSVTWVVKRWLPGGHSERLLGISQPLEALAWQIGLLRPSAMPPGVRVPFVDVRLDRDGRAAWIIMEDVAPALAQYNREVPLQAAEALARAQVILDRMARLHVWWERPERQAALERYDWLVPGEQLVRCNAASYAAALGETPPPGTMAVGPVADESRANVIALLEWMPAGDRSIFAELLCRRERLVSALAPFPRTLLHGDLGDRNLGLWPVAGSGQPDDASELVLIDWEWIGYGTPALDVARLWGSFPVVHDLSTPLPDAAFSYDLPLFYFERYRAYGGLLADEREWLRACSLALLGLGLGQVEFAGEMIRHDVAPVVHGLARQFGSMAEVARSLF
jgi:hypothetical protein